MTQTDAAPSPPAGAPDLSPDDAALLVWLCDRDVECPLCRYNLRGLTVPRCPECGNRLRLWVSVVDPYVKAWITLAVAACGSAGLGFLLLCMVLREGPPHQGLLDWMVWFFILMVPSPLVLLKTRQRFQRLPRATQWMLAIGLSAIPAIAMLMLCLNLR